MMADLDELAGKSWQLVQKHWGKALSSFVVLTDAPDWLKTLKAGHYQDLTIQTGSATIAAVMGPVRSTIVVVASKFARSEEEQAILDALPKEKQALERYAKNERMPYADRVLASAQFSVLDAIEHNDWRAYLAADASRDKALKQKTAELEWLGPTSSIQNPIEAIGKIDPEIGKHGNPLKNTSNPVFRNIEEVHQFVLNKWMQQKVTQDFVSALPQERDV